MAERGEAQSVARPVVLGRARIITSREGALRLTPRWNPSPAGNTGWKMVHRLASHALAAASALSCFALKKRARKRGNLLIADTLRTNVQQCTQHALDTPQNDIFSQLRTICDCPAVFLANSVRAGGQRRPFHHAFKSLMRSSRLPGI